MVLEGCRSPCPRISWPSHLLLQETGQALVNLTTRFARHCSQPGSSARVRAAAQGVARADCMSKADNKREGHAVAAAVGAWGRHVATRVCRTSLTTSEGLLFPTAAPSWRSLAPTLAEPKHNQLGR